MKSRYFLYRAPFQSQKTVNMTYLPTNCCHFVGRVWWWIKISSPVTICWMNASPTQSYAVLKIRLWPPSTGTCVYQTIDMTPITCWPSVLWTHLWQYNELCHTILCYTSPSPLTTPVVWSWVTCQPQEQHKLQQLNHSSMTNVDIFWRLNREHYTSFHYGTDVPINAPSLGS